MQEDGDFLGSLMELIDEYLETEEDEELTPERPSGSIVGEVCVS